ncbi:MAG: MFS transporter, partial [Ferruginibacter sp.]
MINRTIDLYKNAYKGLTNKIWLLSVVMLINRSGTMVLAFMTLYCNHIGFTIKQGGFVVAIYGVGALIGALIGGKLSDKFGFYYTQFCALYLGGIMFIVLGLMKSYNAICVTTFFLAMINESFRPANAAAIAHYSNPQNRTQSFSLVRLAINLGWGVGSALGGFLASVNYHLLFWVDGVTNISAAILLLVILPKVTKAQQLKVEVKSNKIEKNTSPYKDKIFLYFLVLQIIFSSCFFQLFTTIPLFFKEGLLLSEFNIGVIMASGGILIALFEMVIVYKLEGTKPYLKLMGYGTIFMALSFVILNFSFINGFVIALISMIIITLGEMLSMPFMNSFYIARSTERTRGQYAGLYTMSWSVAQILGSSIGAAFAHAYGFKNLWFVVAFLCVFASFGYRFLEKI